MVGEAFTRFFTPSAFFLSIGADLSLGVSLLSGWLNVAAALLKG
jgi:hypothetical protein